MNSKLKIAVIGSVGIPAKYGGFETLVEYVTKALNTQFDFTVYCSAKQYPKKLETYNNSKLHYINYRANGIQSIPYDIKSMWHAVKYADILLILGVSGCMVLPLIKRFTNKKIIVNIDGLEWKRQKWNRFAKFFLKFSEKCAAKYAHTIIADNKVIQDYVWETYHIKAQLIAYGADHCKAQDITALNTKKYPFLNKPYAFKVCRIEPENNIEMILEAFSLHTTLPLVLVGNWHNSEFGINLLRQYSTFGHLFLLDPIYNQNTLNVLRSNCALYVHGHSAGGTNPSLVEAMHLGLPILAFNVNYNIETTQNKALYFKDTETLLRQLKTLNSDELLAIGSNLKTIADHLYTWNAISNRYAALFI